MEPFGLISVFELLGHSFYLVLGEQELFPVPVFVALMPDGAEEVVERVLKFEVEGSEFGEL
jgi:hypothetical protein